MIHMESFLQRGDRVGQAVLALALSGQVQPVPAKVKTGNVTSLQTDTQTRPCASRETDRVQLPDGCLALGILPYSPASNWVLEGPGNPPNTPPFTWISLQGF